MTVLAGLALNWSKTSSHLNVEPMGTILEGYTFRKQPYHRQMLAQAVHDCVPAQTNLDVKASPLSPASGIKQRVTTARLLEADTSVSTSVDTSPVSERPGTSPTRPQHSIT